MSTRKRLGLVMAAYAVVLVCPQGTSAQAPPSGATGRCNDGTYTTAAKKWQACGKHKGVASWFADVSTGAPATPKPAGTVVPAATGAPAAAPSAAVAPTATTLALPGSSSSTKAAAAKRPVAPGGGPGLVWVNTESKVYHCPGSEDYGTTKTGKYMSEADAKQAGARPNRNVSCAK